MWLVSKHEQPRLHKSTYADMVVQVVPHREVNPLIGGDHVSPVAGSLDDSQLVLRPDAA